MRPSSWASHHTEAFSMVAGGVITSAQISPTAELSTVPGFVITVGHPETRFIGRAFRDCLERNPKRKISQAVKRQAAYYFGSLEKAIVALKRDQRFLSGWSKTKIIKILSQMHRSKENLAYANMRHKFPALLSAGEAYFGNWGKALYAAGIDPNEYFVRRAWHQRKK